MWTVAADPESHLQTRAGFARWSVPNRYTYGCMIHLFLGWLVAIYLHLFYSIFPYYIALWYYRIWLVSCLRFFLVQMVFLNSFVIEKRPFNFSCGSPKSWHFFEDFVKKPFFSRNTLQETNISPKNSILKMIFLFPRWDMLIPCRVPSHVGGPYFI